MPKQQSPLPSEAKKGSQAQVSRYDHKGAQDRWRRLWHEKGVDVTRIGDPARPFYNLMMFPYPSAEGLHVGNMYAFTGSDIFGRFKRMQGWDVFEPIGLDGFGIHSENYALKVGRHPMDHASLTQEHFYSQLHTIGAMFDWTRTVETYNPDYYRWTQWLFVQMFKHGLCYRGKAQVNWCPSCKTVLADEQVIDSACERCGNTVEKRELEQWFFKITAYAEKLLENSFRLDWSEKVKIAQQQWIGKKDGINITYPIKGTRDSVTCFTTAPVNFGMTFLVLSPDHDLVGKMLSGALVLPANKLEEVGRYVEVSKAKGDKAPDKGKTGVFTGLFATNRVAGWDVPVWIADFVLKEVGTGAVQGCPGHDYRDFEFAQKHGLPIIRVVTGPDGDTSPIDSKEKVIVSGMPGTMVHSKFLDGLSFREGLRKTMDYIEENGWGKRVTTYHLRDWLISRQRYWGPPIPMIFCEICAKAGKGERPDMPGWYTVPEQDLPVVLPRIDDYKPGDDGIAPLAKHKEFYHVACPECRSAARRETDVSDTFLDSSWYFLRYPSVNQVSDAVRGSVFAAHPSNPKVTSVSMQPKEDMTVLEKTRRAAPEQLPWSREITRRWLPVHMYTGGAEHSVLHLMYSRFITMALRDFGYIDFDEPFSTFYAHGLVIKDGAKMSKSKGNVVNPDTYIDRYGADALRLYLMFTGPYDQGGDFRDSAMEGMSRWVGRVWRMAQIVIDKQSKTTSATLQVALQKAIKKVGEDTERRRYNTAIATMMELTNCVADEKFALAAGDLGTFLLILAPYAPYLTEELWQMLAGRPAESFQKKDSIHHQTWPAVVESLIVDQVVTIIIQVGGKRRDTIEVPRQKAQGKGEVEAAARASANLLRHLSGQAVKKVIFVPGKLINFVV